MERHQYRPAHPVENMPDRDIRRVAPAQEGVTSNLRELIEMDLEAELENPDLSRGMHDIRQADLIDIARNKPESLTESERNKIASPLERRQWGKVFRDVMEGDVLVSVLSDTSDLLAIKNLNDNIFGPSTTDEIISKRRKLTERHLRQALVDNNVSPNDLEDTVLEQNYKFDIFKISGKYGLDVVNILNKVAILVDAEMKAVIMDLADEEEAKHPKKRKLLQKFRGDLEKFGYRITFGSATVETPSPLSDDTQEEKDRYSLEKAQNIILATSGSLQTSRAVAFEQANGYGGEFSTETMLEKIEQIKKLKDKLLKRGNVIVGADDVEHNIFSYSDDGLGLNKDLLREVRKDKFDCRKNQSAVLKDLKNYIKGLNIFDIVKPFVASEIAEVQSESDRMGKMAQEVLAGNQKSYAEAAEILDTNEKDDKYTSQARFHAESIKIDNCAYLSLDVLDVGVDQLLDFEKRVQSVTDAASFAKASLEAGDKMTERLRTMRKKTFNICEKFGITKDGRMNGLVGGDELTLAIDLNAVDKNGKKIFDENDVVINKLIHQLKKETNSRVVKTVIAESRRTSTSHNILERTEEHLAALKNAEEGSAQAKQIEAELRKLEKFIVNNPNNEDAKKTRDELEGFVVAQIDDHFAIRTEDGPDIPFEIIIKKLKSFYENENI